MAHELLDPLDAAMLAVAEKHFSPAMQEKLREEIRRERDPSGMADALLLSMVGVIDSEGRPS